MSNEARRVLLCAWGWVDTDRKSCISSVSERWQSRSLIVRNCLRADGTRACVGWLDSLLCSDVDAVLSLFLTSIVMAQLWELHETMSEIRVTYIYFIDRDRQRR